jgi:hypothetical protein
VAGRAAQVPAPRLIDQPLRRQVKRTMIAEGRKHPASKWLQSVPFLGKVRSAVLIGRVQTPHRFRTKRQF